jgi:hypothetical protein
MMNDMPKRLIGWMVGVIVLVVAPCALAQDVQPKPVDARLEGYETRVTTDAGTAPAWFSLAGLSVLALSVLFKDAKRTHLD